MIQISKDEAKIIREKMPCVPIRRTTHKYYMEEDRRALSLIKRYRQRGEPKA